MYGDISVLATEDLNNVVKSAKRFVTNFTAEFMASAGFVYSDGRWDQVPMCFDTLSMTCMWNLDAVPTPLPIGWRWLSKGGNVKGAGDKSTDCAGRLEIERYKFTDLGEEVTLRPAVLKLPRQVVCVIGSKEMMKGDGGFDIFPDLANFRVYIISLNEIVRLDWLPRVISRLKSEPINLLAWYGGLNPEVSVAKELGWRVRLCFTIENDPVARATSSSNHPEVTHCAVLDARQVRAEHLPDGVIWKGVFGGPPCQLSSRRNSKPKMDTALFECMMDVVNVLLLEQDPHQLYENVVPHEAIAEVVEKWDHITALKSQRHNALDSGSLSQRDRMYWSDCVYFDELCKVEHRCPEVCFEPGWYPESRPVETLLASGDHTDRKVWCVQASTNFRRTANADERDRIIPGLKAGISGKHLDKDVRNIGNGNCFSADVLWHVMREWTIDDECQLPASLMTQADVYAAKPDQLLLYLLNIDTSKHKGNRLEAITELFRGFAERANKIRKRDGLFDAPKMELVLNRHETLAYKVPHACDVPALLASSAAYQIALMVRKDRRGRQSHDMPPAITQDMWVCMLFFSPKGRKVIAEFDDPYFNLYEKGDELEALRPLKNQKPVNAACAENLPSHWAEYSPDRMTEYRKIPHGTKFFKKHDVHDAYHAVDLHDDSKNLCVSKCRLLGRIIVLLRALCGSQGNAWMGTFFPAWIAYCYNFFLGDAWLEWWLQHCDDTLCHGTTEEICQVKWEAMYAIQTLCGMTATTKFDSRATLPVGADDHVGLYWTPQGHRVSDKSVETMKILLMREPKGGVQVTKMRGLIMQCLTLLAWTQDTKHKRLHVMAPINLAVTVWQRDKTYLWGPEQRNAVTQILEMIDVTPRAYAHPSWVCSKDRCLIGQGDWDPAGISWHLFSVAKPNAADVTWEDLHNPDITVMLCMHTKAYNEAQKRWHAYEGEMDSQIEGSVRRCGSYINTCLAPYTDPNVPKYGWGADSKTTLYRLPKLTLPDLKIQFLSAKFQRFTGWSDESAMTRHWPSCRLFTPDAVNNLADAAARIAAQLHARRPDLVGKDAEPADALDLADSLMSCMPLSVHTFHKKPMLKTQEMPRLAGFPIALPPGTAAYTMLMDDAQWSTIAEAYNEDHAEVCGIRMSEIYSILTHRLDNHNSTTTNRVRTWKNKVVFPLSIAASEHISIDDDHTVLYTPCTATKTVDGSHQGQPDLVLVVPDKCKVRLSGVSLDDFPWQPSRGGCDWARWYMREDLVWLAHNGATTGAHATLTATIAAVKAQVWWHGLEDDCRKFVDLCSQCLPMRISMRSVNMGLIYSGRFSMVQMDDNKLSPKIQDNTGYCSVLSFTEVPQGITVFAPRKTKTAREICMLFITRWVAYYSCPTIIGTDLDPALIGKLVTFMNQRMGMVDAVKQAQGMKSNQVESRQRYVNQAIDAAEAKGDIIDAATFNLVLGAAQIKAMQIVETDSCTVFERTHGVPPNTAKQLMDAKHMTKAQLQSTIDAANPADRAVMRALANRCDELLQYHLQKMDQRAKYNQLNLLAKQAVKRGTDYGFSTGQKAAIGDKIVTILEVPVFAENVPSTLKVQYEDGRRSDVMLSKLRPLSVERAEQTNRSALPDQEVQLGELVFYHSNEQEEERGLLAGVVTSIDGSKLTVQIHQPKIGVSTWLPRWEDPSHTHKMLRYKECPPGCRPFPDVLSHDQIVSTGEFTGPGFKLTDDTIYHLKSLGYEVELLTADGSVSEVDAALCLAYDADGEYGGIDSPE
jgi:hypothetical protein